MKRAKLSILIAAAGVFALTACDSMSTTEKRAAQGATAGALIGAATAGGNSSKSAATGALLGGLAGAVVGNAEEKS